MARNERTVDASVTDIWKVLSDPECYEHWVVGSKEIRAGDTEFPKPGTEFHHTFGVGPLALKDKTVAIAAEEPHRLVLRVRAMPMGIGEVAISLQPDGDRTRVVMEEHPAGGPVRKFWSPWLDRITWLRNRESLRRLARLAEQGPRTAAA